MSGESPLARLSEDELLDTLYAVLGNAERRAILRYLSDHPGPVSIAGLASDLATIVNGSEAFFSEQQTKLHVSLIHTHLPKLDAVGFVNWDQNNDSVALSPALEDLVVTTTGSVLDVSVSMKEVEP